MGHQLTSAELGIGGRAAMQGIHAVAEIACSTARQHTAAAGRFHALVRMTNDMGNEHAVRGLRSALVRFLYAAMQALATPTKVRAGVTVSMPEAKSMIRELLPGQNLDVQRVLQIAADCRNLPDFIRAVGDGGTPPADPAALGIAASVVLREVLARHGGNNDPMRRWIVLGQITHTVVAAHYLQAAVLRSPA